MVWPLVVWLFSPGQLKVICLAAIAIVSIGRFAYVATTHDYIAAYILTPFRIDALLIGSLAAVLRFEMPEDKIKTGSQMALLVSLVLLAISLKVFDWRLSGFFVPAAGLTLLPLFFAALIMYVTSANDANKLKRFFSNRMLSFFGKYSYGLYIYHFPVLKLLAAAGIGAYLVEMTHSKLLAVLLFNCAAFAVAIAVAMLSWHLWEKHFLKLKSHFSSDA